MFYTFVVDQQSYCGDQCEGRRRTPTVSRVCVQTELVTRSEQKDGFVCSQVVTNFRLVLNL